MYVCMYVFIMRHIYQIIDTKSGETVARINIVRSKAVISMQPELDVLHRVRIIGTALILLV